jgi:hypothetical protein
VRLVQVTNGKSHSGDIGYFVGLLQKIHKTNPHFKVELLEIFYFVDIKKIDSFTLRITGDKLLYSYGFTNWPPNLVEQKIQIVGVADQL